MRRTGLFAVVVLVIWLATLGLVTKLSVDRLAVPPWGSNVAEAQVLAVETGTVVGQAFRAPYPGLFRIEIWPESQGRAGSGIVTLRRASPPEAVLQASSFSFDELEAGKPYAQEFEPQRDSKGEEYVLSVESSRDGADDAFTLAYSADSDLEGATATLDGDPIAGNLRFQTYYTLRTRDKLDLLLSRLAEGRPYFLGTRGFYVILAIVYALLLAIFLWQIAGLITDKREGSR